MNISVTAKKALIPHENFIRTFKKEHGTELSNTGQLLHGYNGSDVSVPIPLYSNNEGKGLIFTHNHPNTTVKNTGLSIGDIRCGLKNLYCEFRAVTTDGFCHLVEIPQNLGHTVKNKCFDILSQYEFLFPNNFPRKQMRKMQKELAKAGGLKFRTIPIPQE